jgi:ribose transport system ATP-binding protein
MTSSLPPRLELTNLSKTFPGTTALSGVSFELRVGEVHALVGQNGSGKSTLIKVLGGYHQPDAGATAAVDGAAFPLGSHEAAAAAGIRFVHQDLGLIGTLDAVDNVAFGYGYDTDRAGRIRWKRQTQRARELIHMLDYDFDVKRPVQDLAPSERTVVAIVRAVQDLESTKVLVLDEPTASLPRAEVARLFTLIRRVTTFGVSVVYVSHHLDELFDIGDRVTVLRDGRRIATKQTAELDHEQLVRLMTGSILDVSSTRAEVRTGESAMTVTGLKGGGSLAHLDIQVNPGEILGIAGITGSGREVVVNLLAGIVPRGGEMRVGQRLVPPLQPSVAIASGIGVVPSERLSRAVFHGMSVGSNLTIAGLAQFWSHGVLHRGQEKRDADHWLGRLKVVPPDQERSIMALSGGNQQKVILGRWLRRKPRVLLLDEPTQGVDVAAKADIHRLIDEAAASGTAVVVAGSDEEELVRLCHRILVLSHGQVIAELTGNALTEARLAEAVLGQAHGNERAAEHRAASADGAQTESGADRDSDS